MAENQEGFVPPGVDPGAGDKQFREGQQAIDAAKGSGQRAKEAQQQAAEKARRRAEEAAKEFERRGSDPNDLDKVGDKIKFYRKLKGIK